MWANWFQFQLLGLLSIFFWSVCGYQYQQLGIFLCCIRFFFILFLFYLETDLMLINMWLEILEIRQPSRFGCLKNTNWRLDTWGKLCLYPFVEVVNYDWCVKSDHNYPLMLWKACVKNLNERPNVTCYCIWKLLISFKLKIINVSRFFNFLVFWGG